MSNLKCEPLIILNLSMADVMTIQWRHSHYDVTPLHTDRTTESSERVISAIHYVHLMEIRTTNHGERQLIAYGQEWSLQPHKPTMLYHTLCCTGGDRGQ